MHHPSHIETIPDTMDDDHTYPNSVQERITAQDPIFTPAGTAEPMLDQPSAKGDASSHQPQRSLFSRIRQPVWSGECLDGEDLNTKFSCKDAAIITDVASHQVIIAPYEPEGRPTIPEVFEVEGSLDGGNYGSEIPVFSVNGSRFTLEKLADMNSTHYEEPEIKYDNPEQPQYLGLVPMKLVEVKDDAA
jgi:hypothetical protein